MKILIAEDDAVAEKVLRHTLQGFGHEVTSARDGEEAWALFDAAPFRVVVSDWMMPGLDGLQFCERVRNRANTPYPYFILLTAAQTRPEDFDQAIAAGVDDFLTKPFERSLIRARLHVAERILRFTTELRQLKEIIPICCCCSMVRNDEDYWERVETYIRERTGSRFSHGLCPDCFEKEAAKLGIQPEDLKE